MGLVLMFRRVFVDLDDVLADFSGHYFRQFGVQLFPNSVGEPSDFWDNIRTQPEWFLDLPLTADARELWAGLAPYHPTILSGADPQKYVGIEAQKTIWVARHFGPEARLVTCLSQNKCLFGKPGDILIDDWIKYQALWETMGGTFVLHTSARESVAAVQRLFNSPL